MATAKAKLDKLKALAKRRVETRDDHGRWTREEGGTAADAAKAKAPAKSRKKAEKPLSKYFGKGESALDHLVEPGGDGRVEIAEATGLPESFGASDDDFHDAHTAFSRDRRGRAFSHSFETLPIKDITLYQSYVKANMVRDKLQDDDPSIDILRFKGENIIMDGNHRLVAECLKGNHSIKARVSTYNG